MSLKLSEITDRIMSASATIIAVVALGTGLYQAKLSRDQRKLFEQLRETLPVENEPENKGLFDKVKDYFL